MTSATLHRVALAGVLALAVGCRAAAPAAPPAAPTLPTAAQVGGTSIVAIAPPAQACCPKQTLPQFLGITGACEGIKTLLGRLRNRLGAIWPGLEAKPEVLAIADPANLESPNPAVAGAAKIKAEEDQAAQKAKAIGYLASVGCSGCYPDVEKALVAALDDCSEVVRFAAVSALRATAGEPCKNCRTSACCSQQVREKLEKIAYDRDANGCYVEPSDRVRRVARLALCSCTLVPLKPGPQSTRPEEGPAPPPVEAVPPPPPAPAAPPPATAARPAVGYEESLAAYVQRTPAAAGPQEMLWEEWTAPLSAFASRDDALAAMTIARTQALGPGGQVTVAPLVRNVHGWTAPAQLRSAALAKALEQTPAGGVSPVVADETGLHLVRVLARRRAEPTPAAPPGGVQPVTFSQAVPQAVAPPSQTGSVPLPPARGEVPWPTSAAGTGSGSHHSVLALPGPAVTGPIGTGTQTASAWPACNCR